MPWDSERMRKVSRKAEKKHVTCCRALKVQLLRENENATRIEERGGKKRIGKDCFIYRGKGSPAGKADTGKDLEERSLSREGSPEQK